MPLPFFGFSFLISIAIIIGTFFMRLLRLGGIAKPARVHVYPGQRTVRVVTSVFIISAIIVVSLNVYFRITHYASVDHHNSVNVAGSYITDCVPIEEPFLSNRMVVLRLDDVQARSWSTVNRHLMQDALDRGMPIVAGVIPKDIASDFAMSSFLIKNNCNIEIAIHGYTHHIDLDYIAQDGEFSRLTADEARTRLHKAIDETSLFVDTPIRTFIPPQNQISAEAQGVLHEFGLTYLTSEGNGVYDYDAKTWGGISADSVVETCEQRFTAGDQLCVIMLHPQEFSNDNLQVDEEKYREYIKLLDLIEGMNVNVVRFSDVPPEMLK